MIAFPAYNSVTNATTKCGDAILTSVASGIVRREIPLMRRTLLDSGFYFPGLKGVVNRAAPLMATDPSYLSRSRSEDRSDPRGPH
jgi:hypothetical protein